MKKLTFKEINDSVWTSIFHLSELNILDVTIWTKLQEILDSAIKEEIERKVKEKLEEANIKTSISKDKFKSDKYWVWIQDNTVYYATEDRKDDKCLRYKFDIKSWIPVQVCVGNNKFIYVIVKSKTEDCYQIWYNSLEEFYNYNSTIMDIIIPNTHSVSLIGTDIGAGFILYDATDDKSYRYELGPLGKLKYQEILTWKK